MSGNAGGHPQPPCRGYNEVSAHSFGHLYGYGVRGVGKSLAKGQLSAVFVGIILGRPAIPGDWFVIKSCVGA